MSHPNLAHADTQPNLLNIHGATKPDLDESSSESDMDLLEYLNKVDTAYRHVQFHVPDKLAHTSEIKKAYEKRVSFDTVNLQYEKQDDWDDSDDDYDDYDFRESRGRSRGISPSVSPLHSPNGSPSRRMRSPMRNSLGDIDDLSLARMLSNKIHGPEYPTTPIITHRGCTFTKLHRQFEDLYLEKLNNEENGYKSPVLPHRVILVYITARKHTWVALDWILNKYIQDGDSVIIVSAINLNCLAKKRRSSFTSTENIVAKTPRMRLRQRNRPEYVKIIAKNIMSYVMEVMNPEVIAKVSIELAVGKSKKVLQEMYKLYEPNLVATGSKPNTNIGAPLRSWTSSKVTDRLVKNFPLPVIIVPAVNMSSFEAQLELDINSKYDKSLKDVDLGTESVNARILNKAKKVTNTPKEEEENDTDSISSMSSEESYSSFDEITKSYEFYKNDVHQKLVSLAETGYDYNYFNEALKTISDKSAEFCRDVKGIDPDFRGRGAKLARAITGSNSFGVVPYKTKSLLAPVEKTKSAGPTVGGPPKLSYKELKRQLKQNQQKTEAKAPSINITSPPKLPAEPLAPASHQPPKQTLKFVNLEAPSKEKDHRKSKEKDTQQMKSIQKSFSNDVEAYTDGNTRPALEPLKSHPDLRATYDSGDNFGAGKEKKEKKSKKKSRKFWKLFS